MIKKTFDLEMCVPNGRVTKPIVVVQLDSKYWIDLESVLKALGMGWKKWHLYFHGCADKFGLLRHDDEYLGGSLLVLPTSMPSLLAGLYALPGIAQRHTASNRIQGMQACWSRAWLTSPFNHREDVLVSRKVCAATVGELYRLLKTGQTLTAIAAKIGVSTRTAGRLKNGTYPMDRQTSLAWLETFGNRNASV
jgi:hypothetical protein